MGTAEIERAKYEKVWAIPAYSDFSPGGKYMRVFGEIAEPKTGETIIDLGCGTGVGVGAAIEDYGLNATFLDFVNAGAPAPFIEQPLWSPIPGHYDYGYCCDVMEHIPPEYVMLVLERICVACDHAFFSICNVDDAFGKQVGERLHLTVQPFEWWRDHLADMGEVLHARDLLGESLFYVRCR